MKKGLMLVGLRFACRCVDDESIQGRRKGDKSDEAGRQIINDIFPLRRALLGIIDVKPTGPAWCEAKRPIRGGMALFQHVETRWLHAAIGL